MAESAADPTDKEDENLVEGESLEEIRETEKRARLTQQTAWCFGRTKNRLQLKYKPAAGRAKPKLAKRISDCREDIVRRTSDNHRATVQQDGQPRESSKICRHGDKHEEYPGRAATYRNPEG